MPDFNARIHKTFCHFVGKAATVPPALVVLSYEPAAATETIALVGKGIVYDTGGLSIKGKTAMPGMKRDCGGAAAILGKSCSTTVLCLPNYQSLKIIICKNFTSKFIESLRYREQYQYLSKRFSVMEIV